MAKKRVILAISGGLDSSAAGKILTDKGYEVLGVFLRLGLNKDKDEAYARKVCEHLGIEFYPVNAAARFHKEIVDYFLDSYSRGITPNPCIKCNQAVKFRELIKLADVLDFSYVSTGHYAKVIKGKNAFRLLKGEDNVKDQSYFLYRLSQEQLKRILFPLGKYKKEEIRKWALRQGLPFLDSESQDVCFIEGPHNEFLKKNLHLKPGPIKTWEGKKLGEHQGLPLYTIGQRRGVEIGGIGPLYVVKTDYKNNVLYVTDDSRDPLLFSSEILLKNVNWIAGKEPELPRNCEAVTRYGQAPQKAVIKKGDRKDEYKLEFRSPQRAVTPGQSAVFYNGKEVMGGGVITSGEFS